MCRCALLVPAATPQLLAPWPPGLATPGHSSPDLPERSSNQRLHRLTCEGHGDHCLAQQQAWPQVTGGLGRREAVSDTGHRHGHSCWLSVTSGIPPQQPLFNGSACPPPSSLLALRGNPDSLLRAISGTQVCTPMRHRCVHGASCWPAAHR